MFDTTGEFDINEKWFCMGPDDEDDEEEDDDDDEEDDED